jgi:hypothetical protein
MNNTKNLLHEIITTGKQSGVENLKMLNRYRDLLSEEAFLELENIAMDQIINPLFDRNLAA